jgi:hypothetical protein
VVRSGSILSEDVWRSKEQIEGVHRKYKRLSDYRQALVSRRTGSRKARVLSRQLSLAKLATNVRYVLTAFRKNADTNLRTEN